MWMSLFVSPSMQAVDRDAGPRPDDLGDVVGADLLLEQRAGSLERGERRLLLGHPVGQLLGVPYLSSAAVA